MVRQRVPDGFDPFGEVGVLEHESVEFVRIRVLRVIRKRLETAERVFRRDEGLAFLAMFGVLRRRGLEVVHAVAGCGSRHVVVEGVPLERDHLRAHEFLFGCPEGVRDRCVPQCDGMTVLRHVHSLPVLLTSVSFDW